MWYGFFICPTCPFCQTCPPAQFFYHVIYMAAGLPMPVCNPRDFNAEPNGTFDVTYRTIWLGICTYFTMGWIYLWHTMRRNLLNNVLHIWSGKNVLIFSWYLQKLLNFSLEQLNISKFLPKKHVKHLFLTNWNQTTPTLVSLFS